MAAQTTCVFAPLPDGKPIATIASCMCVYHDRIESGWVAVQSRNFCRVGYCAKRYMARGAQSKAACGLAQYTKGASHMRSAQAALPIDVVNEKKCSGIKNWFLAVNPDGGFLAAHPEQCWATFLPYSLEDSIAGFGAKGQGNLGKSQVAIFESTKATIKLSGSTAGRMGTSATRTPSSTGRLSEIRPTRAPKMSILIINLYSIRVYKL